MHSLANMADLTSSESSDSRSDEQSWRRNHRPKLSKTDWRARLGLYGVLAVAALFAGLLVWLLFSAAEDQRDFQLERAKAAVNHEIELEGQAVELLRTSGTLLGLAIRTPLLADDFEAIERQIKPLLQEKRILIVAVADRDNIVRIATNHRIEGQTIGEAFPGLPTTASEVTVTPLDNRLVAQVAVTDAGQVLGRAVISFAQEL